MGGLPSMAPPPLSFVQMQAGAEPAAQPVARFCHACGAKMERAHAYCALCGAARIEL